ncbi:Na/Pi cotransporter family protein [Thalassobium sp. R2A62]|uniref:Na/Pi cotransporter family protein n=1 Tax=Thalassobium sp. R2A62 TaxID=633131 RepID=UPI0001B1CC53|nr:Na/Pi cotransporter family protein [Thalassobium sp. R2A62]EET46465.1 Na+/Pi-cotransporter [Thalassobium sp. R2A62]
MANLILRGGGAALVLLGIVAMPDLLTGLGTTPDRQAINLHLAFSVGLALVAFPFVGPIMAVASYLMPERPDQPRGLKVTSALDPALLDRPGRAIDCAARELLAMGQKIEQMLITVEPIYDQWNTATASLIADQDKAVKQTHLEIKLCPSSGFLGPMAA